MNHYNCVYIAKCICNGKWYVGQAKDFNRRKDNHRRDSIVDLPVMDVHKAIKKYGLHNFVFCLVAEDLPDKATMDALENELILKYNTIKYGYNRTYGGDGFAHGDLNPGKRPEVAKKISDALTQWHADNPDAWIGNQFGKGNKSKQKTDEHRANLADANKGTCTGLDNSYWKAFAKRHGSIYGPLFRDCD